MLDINHSKSAKMLDINHSKSANIVDLIDFY